MIHYKTLGGVTKTGRLFNLHSLINPKLTFLFSVVFSYKPYDLKFDEV